MQKMQSGEQDMRNNKTLTVNVKVEPADKHFDQIAKVDTSKREAVLENGAGTLADVHLSYHMSSYQICGGNNTQQDMVKCQSCGQIYLHDGSDVSGAGTQTGEKSYKCQYCRNTLPQQHNSDKTLCEKIDFGLNESITMDTGACANQEYKKHVSTAVNKLYLKPHITNKPSYQCQYCEKIFTLKSNCVKHERIHTGERRFKCRYCDKTFVEKRSCIGHEMNHTGEKPFKCQYCEKAFTLKSNCIQHEKTHTGEKPFKCEYCSKTYTAKYSLLLHERTHTGEKPYKCQYCDKTFAQKVMCINHERTHTGEKPYKCQYCEKEFSWKDNCARHEMIHSERATYKCQYCDKTFYEKSYCVRHEKINHEGTYIEERPHKCQYCDKTFPRKNTCMVHERIHTGEKPFKCQYCVKAFNIKSTCVKHERIHTGEKPFQCQHCEKAFAVKQNCKEHEKNCGKSDRLHFEIHSSQDEFRESSPVSQEMLHECPVKLEYSDEIQWGVTMRETKDVGKYWCGGVEYQCLHKNYLTRDVSMQGSTASVQALEYMNDDEIYERIRLTGTRRAVERVVKPDGLKAAAKLLRLTTFMTLFTQEFHFRYAVSRVRFDTVSTDLLNTSDLKKNKKKLKMSSPNIVKVEPSVQYINNTPKMEEPNESQSVGETLANGAGNLEDVQLGMSIPLDNTEGAYGQEKQHKCQYCDRTFTYRRNRLQHERSCILTRTQEGPKVYKCQYCDRSFSKKFSCIGHERLHTGEKPYKCKYCDKAYTRRSTWLQHEKNHAPDKPFKCQYCEKSFGGKSHHERHELTHTGEKPYKCRFCDAGFALKSNVVQHEKIHTGEKAFKCQYCGKSFTAKYSLSIHHRLHTGEKPYKCQYCDKTFNQKYAHKVHELIHTGEKLYKCRYCKNEFAKQANCTRHEALHTDTEKEFYQCVYCEKIFFKKEDCILHQYSCNPKR
ncbi:zinc finger protein 665-like [Lingula anatina]|uniref:Zinc finger protein 665-like n=1 Tax=Lingula anatina TaxID=7574 RepID=A0A1S3IGP6_LINAN|nr:zinc finger protein 665-like [Lingula anatina]|eukprot:XP_013397435.2 zinc finger protein 665-like [Lingula anatina]